MNNWDIRNIVNYLINKSQTGNTFGVDEINQMINYNSLKLFKRRIGMPEEYQLQPFTRQSYATTVRILDSLGVFIENKNLSITNGVVDKPLDYLYPIAHKTKIAQNSDNCDVSVSDALVELVDENEFTMRNMSELTPINVFYPVYKIVGDKFYIYPITIQNTTFSYLRKPVDAVIAVTLDANDNEVYDASASTELEWGDLDKLEIINMILGDVGLNLRSEEIIQASNQLKTTGL